MRIAMLSGGVGGARLARGFAALDDVELTVIVNVGDDERIYGLHVAPDLDTVVYTLAGIEGPAGWGMAGETWKVMRALARFPIDTTFRLGDTDLATNLFRTDRLDRGVPLSQVTAEIADAFDVEPKVIPATDDPLRTVVRTPDAGWLPFQEYFVTRRHADTVTDVRFDGAERAQAAPGVVAAIEQADAVVIAPSNPVLSIWPILAVAEVAKAVEAASRVVAVSPLFGGEALKGPAAKVLTSLGYPAGNAGVIAAYDGLLTDLVVDTGDEADRRLGTATLSIRVTDTHIARPEQSRSFAERLLRWL